LNISKCLHYHDSKIIAYPYVILGLLKKNSNASVIFEHEVFEVHTKKPQSSKQELFIKLIITLPWNSVFPL